MSFSPSFGLDKYPAFEALNEASYPKWSLNMQNYLMYYGVWQAVEGHPPVAEAHKQTSLSVNRAEWLRTDSEAKVLIMQKID